MGQIMKNGISYGGASTVDDASHVACLDKDGNDSNVQTQLNELNSKLMPNTYIEPTNLASGITVASGGYVLFGNLVVVNCRFNVTTAKSGTTVIATFPAPVSGDCKINIANNKKLDLGITSSGNLQTYESISTGSLVVSTCYLKG